jgi:hypothetical protein
MVPQEFLAPYLVANALALAVLTLTFWRRDTGRWAGVALFACAALANTWTAAVRPGAYLDYAALTPSAIYRDFILGWFSGHVQAVVLSIALGQVVIAVLLASHHATQRRIGVAGALTFLLAIAPLGVGSGFPFSLVFGAALLVSQGVALAPRARPPFRRIPRLLGVLLVVFLSVFALDEFRGVASGTRAARDFAIHLIPAGIVLAVLLVAWRWERAGAVLFLMLAGAYGALTGWYLSWMFVIALPLLLEGALFFWSWRLGHRHPPLHHRKVRHA